MGSYFYFVYINTKERIHTNKNLRIKMSQSFSIKSEFKVLKISKDD